MRLSRGCPFADCNDATARAALVNLPFLSSPLPFVPIYFWSRRHPATPISLFGLITLPVAYFPYALIVLDLLMGGPKAAASSVTGAVIGHIWWWGVFESRRWVRVGTAPSFLKNWIDGDGRRPGNLGGGVQVIPPKRREEPGRGATGGHNWGAGHRLGTE